MKKSAECDLSNIQSSCFFLFSLTFMVFTHMQLSDVEVRLDWTQFPRLVLQKHPQLFQPSPEKMQRREKKQYYRKGVKCDEVKRR